MIDIYCEIIDNYGDAGFCLRLGRELAALGQEARVFCTNMGTISAIMSDEDRHRSGLSVLPWDQLSDNCPQDRVAQVVIAAFSCHLPKVVLQRARDQGSLIINLEYLSAEAWVEGCHGRASPGEGITSYFFFPGFTKATGGLLVEQAYREACLGQPQIQGSAGPTLVSLFSYANDQVLDTLLFLTQGVSHARVLAFEGLALDNLRRLLGHPLAIGDHPTIEGRLEIVPTRMVPQPEYDRILLNCDLNLVRGEDSIVRAMLAGKPFLWHIYPQEGDTHITKLKSFLSRMQESAPPQPAGFLDLMLHYNGRGDLPTALDYPALQRHCQAFSRFLLGQDQLAVRLMSFINEHLNHKMN
ncbi:MAG: elongation factor P maturation arginine rhamnosyltransferase EarP [Succinivibrionaceae bacterium]|nr:elongation factor P maturation arginine rhamnosyltransferase EarP [Succinivibrionaceae bacterium]